MISSDCRTLKMFRTPSQSRQNKLHRRVRFHTTNSSKLNVATLVHGRKNAATHAQSPGNTQPSALCSDTDAVVAENTAVMIADMAGKPSSAVAVYQCVALVRKLCEILNAAVDALQRGHVPVSCPSYCRQAA